MSVFTNPLIKRVNDVFDNGPDGVVDALLVAGACQVAALSFYGAGKVIPGIDQFTAEMLDDGVTRLEKSVMQTMTPWSV